MKIIPLLLLVFILLSCASLKERPIVGEYKWGDWVAATKWNSPPSSFYNFDSLKLKQLLAETQNKEINYVIFASSFCSECKENLPRIIAVFEKAGIPQSGYRLFGLDDDLEEPSGYYKKFNIKNTPVVFVLSDNRVIGSVEFPPTNWLDDLLKICSK
ncbi:MAG: hypothetical protein WCT77_11200 [Bacteroidota bacterium]|jgi:hypothetical protein